MILDSSALLTLLRRDRDHARLADLLLGSTGVAMSVDSYLKTAAVLEGHRDPTVRRALDDVLDVVGVTLAPMTAEQAVIAREAFRDYGSFSGHAARLTTSECVSYALARVSGRPLLHTRDGLRLTDVDSVELTTAR